MQEKLFELAGKIVLGVVVGLANTTDQFMVSRSAPDAPDFVNGLFLTTTNLGTTIGTSVCGVFISGMGTSFSVLGTLPCLAFGFVFVLIRMKCAQVGVFKAKEQVVRFVRRWLIQWAKDQGVSHESWKQKVQFFI